MSKTVAKNQNADLHSEAVNEMIEQGPGKIMQYAIISFFIIIILLIGLSGIIMYPDTEYGECVIYADNAPRPVLGGTEGQMGSMLVSDGDYVRRNQPLGLIKSSVRFHDVLKLEALVQSCLDNIQQGNFEKIFISPSHFYVIGEFQGAFQHLYWTYRQLRSNIQSPLFKHISNASGPDMERIYSSSDVPVEFREFEKQFFELLSEFMHAINDMNASISSWKQKYLLIAPIDGIVVFPEVVFHNKEITAGKEVLYIDPPVKNYYGQVTLEQHSYRNVRKGQPVIIELESNSKNYEPLRGHVLHKSPILNKDGKFIVKVMFDKRQLTGAGQPIHFMNELKGSGRIITNSSSLLSRIVKSVQN